MIYEGDWRKREAACARKNDSELAGVKAKMHPDCLLSSKQETVWSPLNDWQLHPATSCWHYWSWFLDLSLHFLKGLLIFFFPKTTIHSLGHRPPFVTSSFFCLLRRRHYQKLLACFKSLSNDLLMALEV